MTTFPLDIRLAEDHLSIGSVALRPKGSSLDYMYQLLGQPDRVVPLPYNNTVYIYDRLGIRFWAEAGIVGEWQLVLEVEPRETFPQQAFVGPIEYQQYVLYPPASGDVLTTGKWPGFSQDTDPLQYGVVMFVAKKPHITYTVILNSQTGAIKNISAS